MKKSFLLLFLFVRLGTLNAAILLVNNTTGGANQYSEIDSAMVHANAGDTLYVSGSNIIYSKFTVTKSIVILGPGAYSEKQNAFPAKVNGIKFLSNISNIKICGFYFTNYLDIANLSNVSYVELSSNYTSSYFNFSSSSNFSYWNFANTIFAGIGLNSLDFVFTSGFSNILIQNNIFFGAIRSLSAGNGLVANNAFLNMPNAFEFFSSSLFNNAIIKDNIFYNANPTTNTIGCTYSNNLSYSTTAPFSAMTGTGNIDNVNPNFIAVAAGGYTTAFDFHLQAGSPAIGSALNGGDLGYYGGTYHTTTTGEPENMPVIRNMDILNYNLPQNGNVNVKVRSTNGR